MLKLAYQKELKSLTPRQRHIVLDGLVRKLGLYRRKGILSYQYNVCPVCKDVGSTLENDSNCTDCYIHQSCKAPFNDGFRDDPEMGAAYFQEMRDFLGANPLPEVLVVGGTWDEKGGRPSKIITALANELEADRYNGGSRFDLRKVAQSAGKYDLIVWMPNVDNDHEKIYPKKAQGAVLICSKVMRPGYAKAEAITRIFQMHANAVIQIHKPDRYVFTLTDALGNDWSFSSEILKLVQGILELYQWTEGVERVGSRQADVPDDALQRFLACTRFVADQVENEVGSRYFGNVATRCQRMFPGIWEEDSMYVSPRNTDKRRLQAEDMVLAWSGEDREVLYMGSRKPSVDTPVQLEIARKTDACVFIHGHAKVVGAPTTKHYYPCGDLREAPEVIEIIRGGGHYGVINLKNHGFLLYSKFIEGMEKLVKLVHFAAPN